MSGTACGLVTVLALVWGQVAPGAKTPTAEEIAALVKQLGADDFGQRQAATDALWLAGSAAEAALREAIRNDDPEIRFRAAAILDKVRAGVRPDTPPDVAALIDQFRFGADAAQRQVLTDLRNKGQWPIVLSLVREADANRRRSLALAVAPDAGKLIRPLIEKGQLAEAESILDLTAVQQSGLVQLVTFLSLTNRLDGAIDNVKSRTTAATAEDDHKRLAFLLRAKGDLPGAIEAAEKTSDKLLRLNLLAEARDWKRAAELMLLIQADRPTVADYPAFTATFHRLAGNVAGYTSILDDLTKRTRVAAPAADPFAPPGAAAVSPWTLAEARLINEQPDEALTPLLTHSPERAITLLRHRQQFAKALTAAKVTDDTTFDAAWLKSLPAVAGDEKIAARSRFAVAAQTALLLRDLGKTAAVDQILDTLASAAAADPDEGRRWTALAKLQWQLVRYDEALKAATLAASTLPSQAVFAELIKPQATLASFWFGSAFDLDPSADREKALADAVWISVPRPPVGKHVADWKKRVEAAVTHVRKLDPKVRAAYLVVIAETCLVRDDRDLARQFFMEAAETAPIAAIKVADLYARDANWAEAEKWYGQAAAGLEGDSLSLFLQGRALVELGRVDEGKEKQRLASLLPLAPEARFPLAAGLQERGLAAEAVAQFEIIRRTAPLDSSLVVNAAQQIGNLVNGKEPLRAADCWEQLLLHVLNGSSNFIEIEGYLSLPHIMHKVRARGLLDAGKHAELSAELAACQRVIPGDVKLIEDMVPRLDKAGLKDEADKLFAAAHAIHSKIAQDFPTSATYLNNTAWISARARRKLDEALPLAQKAIELAPKEAAYWDTLAEVHFQRGDRPAAVAAARKCLELSPGNSLFERRLKHFEEDEPGKVDGDDKEP